MRYLINIIVILITATALHACNLVQRDGANSSAVVAKIDNQLLTLELDNKLHSRLTSHLAQPFALQRHFQASEYVEVDGQVLADFTFLSHSHEPVQDALGSGERHTITGIAPNGLQKTLIYSVYDNYPASIFLSVTYTNDGQAPLRIARWVNHRYELAQQQSGETYWSYQGASYSDRRDWIAPVTPGFEQQNYMGMNASDYGGGTPVADVWGSEVGLAVGHIETTPKLVSLPVSYTPAQQGANLHIEYDRPATLASGESVTTFRTFLHAHTGDYYNTLKTYRQLMAAQGLKSPHYPESSYEPIWCAWGYERNFTLEQVLATLPKAKDMGFTWAVLDDGWQTSEGDWHLDHAKFPGGDKDMRELVKKIHAAGMKAKVWWAPLAVDPGTDLIEEHEDMLILDKNGKPVDITWWDSYYLCPAYEKTREYSKQLVKTMMDTWGYEGLKLDGHHLNGVPPCYNPAHNHSHPEESVEALQSFWKLVFDTAQDINRDSVVEFCPCGTAYAFHNIPYTNQTVSSDPLSSWQIRTKGKTLKALMGESAPYFGDHVELSDGGSDFASSVGIGAIVGTKFTWPSDHHAHTDYLLTPEKEAAFRKWVEIYKAKMLSQGVYRGELYDIGFDRPETHAIQKGEVMNFAFYADNWSGKIELRGLEKRQYRIHDYENNQPIATVTGPTAQLNLAFKKHLLIEAIPLE